MYKVRDRDYRDSETLWLLITPDQDYPDVRADILELTREDVQEMLDDFDQEETGNVLPRWFRNN
jgi:hypothetical protein